MRVATESNVEGVGSASRGTKVRAPGMEEEPGEGWDMAGGAVRRLTGRRVEGGFAGMEEVTRLRESRGRVMVVVQVVTYV